MPLRYEPSSISITAHFLAHSFVSVLLTNNAKQIKVDLPGVLGISSIELIEPMNMMLQNIYTLQ